MILAIFKFVPPFHSFKRNATLQALESPILPSRLPISEVIPTSKMDETAKSINIDLIFPDFGSLVAPLASPELADADAGAAAAAPFGPAVGCDGPVCVVLDRAFGLKGELAYSEGYIEAAIECSRAGSKGLEWPEGGGTKRPLVIEAEGKGERGAGGRGRAPGGRPNGLGWGGSRGA